MSRKRRSETAIQSVERPKEQTALRPPPEPSEADPHELAAAGVYMSTKVTRGPLPPPATLAEYDEVLPGLAERIAAAFEAESQHRRESDRFEQAQFAKQVDAQVRQIDAGIRDDRLKIFLSASLAMGVVGVAALLAWTEHPAYAVALVGGSGGIVGLASGARWLIRRDSKSSRKDNDE